MRHLPVHWYEGLFLRPHHFQAHERHWQEALFASVSWDHPHYWGILEMDLSRDALAAGQLEVRTLRARMRDGTLVDRSDGNPLDRVDLKSAFDVASTVTAYLAVPRLHLGEQNVGNNGAGSHRFRENRMLLQDEANGGNDQEVSFRELDVQIRLSTDELSGFETLPIGRFRRTGESSGATELLLDYIPPTITLRSWAPLGELYRDICDIITRKRDVLASQVAAGGMGFDMHAPDDVQRVLMFITLNQLLGGLQAYATTRHVHPFVAYTELCRAVGALDAFDRSRIGESVPAYDHDDLGTVFRTLRSRIENAIRSVQDHPYYQRYFQGVSSRMQVTLEPEWFHSDWQWFVGVRKGDLSDTELQDLLSPGKLDWKLGSARQVEMLFTQRLPGLQLRPVGHKLPVLPPQRDWMYLEVPRTDSPAWRDVQDSQTLAIRFRDSLILNRDRLQGERRILVDDQGDPVSLEMALFAVPS
ncbi:MAG: type VI secretion system baseplate subunit TssK [Planctomycetaceae bacterium]|nr:type VI secretion system baseplate subunit TssK [Planctomycetaceae bacterium]